MTTFGSGGVDRPRFGRVLTAMVTPFDDAGRLDLDRAQELAKYLVANGNDGIVVAGTTGESATLTHDEQIELIAAVREAIPDHSLVAGAGSNDTRAAVELTERATAAGADGILQVTPYYNRPNQAGIEMHFEATAESTDLPVILYDIPVRTGRKIADDVLLRLLEVDNICGVKDAAGSPAVSSYVLRDAPADTDFYSGDDSFTLPLLSIGACGVIGVATHWVGNEMSAMMEAFFSGRIAEARELNAKMLESFAYETGDAAPNPIPTKVLMKLLGVPVGPGRPPMDQVPGDQAERAKAVLVGLGRDV